MGQGAGPVSPAPDAHRCRTLHGHRQVCAGRRGHAHLASPPCIARPLRAPAALFVVHRHQPCQDLRDVRSRCSGSALRPSGSSPVSAACISPSTVRSITTSDGRQSAATALSCPVKCNRRPRRPNDRSQHRWRGRNGDAIRTASPMSIKAACSAKCTSTRRDPVSVRTKQLLSSIPNPAQSQTPSETRDTQCGMI